MTARVSSDSDLLQDYTEKYSLTHCLEPLSRPIA